MYVSKKRNRVKSSKAWQGMAKLESMQHALTHFELHYKPKADLV